MRTPVKITVILVLFVAVIFGCFEGYGFLHDWRLKEAGNELAKKVENFRQIHGRLPSDLSELHGGQTSDNLFYNKMDEKNYMIWFGKGLGESVYYDSSKGRWSVGG